MKNNAILTICLSLVILLSSCEKERVKPSGTITTETIEVSGFTEIEITNEFIAYVTFSDVEEKVEIKSNENLHEFIQVEKIGDRLVIDLVDNLCINGEDVLEAYITTSNIDFFKASDEAQFILQDELNETNVTVELSSESRFEGLVNCNNMDITLSGESEADLNGHIDNLDLALSGESEFTDYDLDVDQLTASMSGESEIQLTVNNSITITGSGESQLTYKGDAAITSMDLSGDADIKHEN